MKKKEIQEARVAAIIKELMMIRGKSRVFKYDEKSAFYCCEELQNRGIISEAEAAALYEYSTTDNCFRG